MNAQTWLDDVQARYRQYKDRCERAAAQVCDEEFFSPLGRNENSIAVLMKHVAGNLRSRWRDFLETDGEKPDRDRDSEFSAEGETRASVQAKWAEGWRVALDTLASLDPADVARTVTIRGEPLSVVQAIDRNLTHAAYHTGQIVQLARHFARTWQTLSIAPGESEEFNATMRAKYGDWWATDQCHDGAG